MRATNLVPGVNFVSIHRVDVNASAAHVWDVLPTLPIALTRITPSAVALGLPLLLAAALRRDLRLSDLRVRPRPLRLEPGRPLLDGTRPNVFDVTSVDHQRELVVRGRHRYADYVTNLYLEPVDSGSTRVYNAAWARFSRRGLGLLYLGGVHVFHDVYINWALACLKSLAEEPAGA